MKKTSLWGDLLKPVVVLTVICLLVSAALAKTNEITLPIIEANAAAAANATRVALLPEADTFVEVPYDGAGVTDVYMAVNGAGYVITGTAKGYGGDVPVAVAFDDSGKIVAISIKDTAETPGLGKKVENADFRDQFAGLDAQPLVLNTDVQAVAGATISSSAATAAVNFTIDAYNAVAKGQVKVEVSEEERAASLLGVEEAEYLGNGAYHGDTGYVFVETMPGYENAEVKCLVAIADDGAILGLWVDASTQTPGLGSNAGEKAHTDQFTGKRAGDELPVIAGAPYSSNAVNAAVAAAFDAFAAVKGVS